MALILYNRFMETFIYRPEPDKTSESDPEEINGPTKDVRWYMDSGLSRKEAEFAVSRDEEVQQRLEEIGN